MKKTTPFLALIAGIVLLVFFSFQARTVTGSGKGTASSPTMPDSIMNFVQKSCMACHTNDGNGMAKAHVNFDKWDSYGEKKQPGKAQDICDVLTKGKMPPKGFRANNPDAVPTEKDIKMVCAWAATFKK
ncbi:MAG: heme-binding domain-containing protein [bacterium]